MTLDLSVGTPSEISNALFKARSLRDVLVDLTATLEELADVVVRRQSVD